MTERSDEALSRRERQIMDIVYAQGEATAAAVLSAMPDPPTKTAVRTLLRILEDKGHLSHRQDGQTYIFCPIRPRGPVGKSAFKRVLQTFFDGSLEKAVAAHLGDSATELSQEELNRLAALIEQARRKGA